MSSEASERKDEHLRLANAQFDRTSRTDFDAVSFVHHALAGGDLDAVDLSVTVPELQWRTPLYINAMTGGSDRALAINTDLAIAARETGIAIATGSQAIALRDPSVRPSFETLREHNPDGFVFANVNATVSPSDAARAIDMLDANALQVHLNAAQEIVMPEGDRSFSGWLDGIIAIREHVDVPVVVKEVGFGLSRKTVLALIDAGIDLVDVSGSGGTDFARIENARRAGHDYSYLEGWGQSTVVSLLDSYDLRHDVTILASGGVRSPLDVAKALALGAVGVGASGVFLHCLVDEGRDALIALIERWLDQVMAIMTVLGATTIDSLTSTDVLLTGRVLEYCGLRGIDAGAFSHRSD